MSASFIPHPFILDPDILLHLAALRAALIKLLTGNAGESIRIDLPADFPFMAAEQPLNPFQHDTPHNQLSTTQGSSSGLLGKQRS